MAKCKNNMTKCDFSLRHYQEILSLLKKRGYKFCFFSDNVDKNAKTIYLRHDIDFSPEKAPILARIENQNNVRATYFIRLGSPLYNIFDPTYFKIIKEISDLGHQIGLHLERDTYGSGELTKEEIEKTISLQLQILREYFDIKSIVSFHQAARFKPNILNQKFESFTSTYEPKFFTESKYLADSNGIWIEDCICKWLTSESCPSNLHALTHPACWDRKGRKNLNKYFRKDYLKKKIKYLNNSLAKNSKIYKKKSIIIHYDKK